MDRNELLASINEQLKERGLKQLPKLGDAAKGEIEITGVKKVIDDSKRFFTDVMFEVKFPNGAPGQFTVRFNANGAVSDGAVIVPIINGKFAIVKQWRLPLARWTYELPRGFGEKIDAAKLNGQLGTVKIGDLPLGTLQRELSEEVMATAEIRAIAHLGSIAENTGTHGVVPSYFLVSMTVDEDRLAERLRGSESDIKVQLWDKSRVKKEIGNRLCDSHTLTAVLLALTYFESFPQ